MKTRNLYFDNAKFLLIFLVVLGHFTNLNRSIPIMGGLNNIIYSFHMPLFIFISGFFSKNINKQRKSEIDKILYIYIVFEIINYLFTKFTSLGYGSFNIFRPTYQNWYILGIFFWRLLIPYFNFYPKWISFLTILITSLIIGFFKDFNTFLGLYRIIYFMPIFALGYYSDNINIILVKFQKYKLIFITLLILSFVAIFTLSISSVSFNNLISYAYTPYEGYGKRLDIIVRILGLITSYILGFFILFTIPSKKTFFTRFGGGTINVFLLHMFLVFPINAIFVKLNLDDEVIFTTSILASIFITYFLSLNFINFIMKPFVSINNLLSPTTNIVHLATRNKHLRH
jgi:fucose 4-O-acetylase-like acetyltransferase